MAELFNLFYVAVVLLMNLPWGYYGLLKLDSQVFVGDGKEGMLNKFFLKNLWLIWRIPPLAHSALLKAKGFFGMTGKMDPRMREDDRRAWL